MTLTLRIERLVAGGDGLARQSSGPVVFVSGGLPGELVEAEVVGERKDYLRARAIEIRDPSPDRVAAPCPHRAAGCGGCPWQHLAPEAQHRWKREIVVEALRRTGGLSEPTVVSGGSVTPFGYRSTLRLAGHPSGRFGFRSARSHAVVPIDHCPVAHPTVSALLASVNGTGVDELVLRVGEATGERCARWSPSDRRLDGLPDDVAHGPGALVHEVVDGARLQVSSGSFFQSGRQAAELLVEAVRAATGGAGGTDDPVVDAFAGVGLLARLVVDAGTEVMVLERSATAVADADVNLAGRRATVVPTGVERWTPRPAGLVIADPPRSGLGRVGVGVLAGTGARRLVLVSCDPAPLGRDARLLQQAGYHHWQSTVLDLFPHTPHMEVVSRFDRQEA